VIYLMTELLDVTVEAIPVPISADALAVRTELCRRFGAEEVFLLEDLHSDDCRSQAGTGTVVGFGRLGEISVTGDRITVRGDGEVANLLRARCGRTTTNVRDMLREVMSLFRVRTEVQGFAFGFLTTVGYDAAALMEDLPPRHTEPDVPDLTLTLFQHTLWFGAEGGQPVLVCATGPDLASTAVAGVPA
jgi:anthranilate synthase component 1